MGRAVGRSTAQLRSHEPGVRAGVDPEAVHRFRVATRRLRSDLATFRPLLDPGPVADLRADLAWLGGVVGAVRDADVLAARLAASAGVLGVDPRAPTLVALLAVLDHERDAARVELLAALDSVRYASLLARLDALAASPPARPRHRGRLRRPARSSARLRRIVGRRWDDLAAAAEALPPDLASAADADLHRVRIRAKRVRYAADAVADAVPAAAPFAAALTGLQDVLGEHHDAVVATARLRDLRDRAAAGGPDGAVELVDGLLAAEDRARRAALDAWAAAWTAASRRRLRRWLG